MSVEINPTSGKPSQEKSQEKSQGKISHFRTNPAGLSYGFDCFQAAPGCTVIGTPSTEHTWFDGYRWQISVCKQCGEHLGWRFKGESQFFGLIHGRIISMVE